MSSNSSKKVVPPKISKKYLDLARNAKNNFSVKETDDSSQTPAKSQTTTSSSLSSAKTDKNSKENCEVSQLEKALSTSLSISKPKKSIKILSDEEDDEIVKPSFNLTKQLEKEADIMKKQQHKEELNVVKEEVEEEEEEIVPINKINRNKRIILDDDEEEEVIVKPVVKPPPTTTSSSKQIEIVELSDEDDEVSEVEEQEEEEQEQEEEEDEEEIVVNRNRSRLVKNNKKIIISDDDDEEESEEMEVVDEEEEIEEKKFTVKGKNLTKEELEIEADDLDEEDDEEEEEEEEEDDDEDDFIDDEEVEDDDDEDYEEDEEEEEEDDVYIPPKRTRDSKPIKQQQQQQQKSLSSKSKSAKHKKRDYEEEEEEEEMQEEEEEEEGEEEEEAEEIDDSKETVDKFEDQMNGFLKNLRTSKYHSSTKYKNQKSGKTQEYILSTETYEKLFWYQREGIDWMWKLFCKGAGGILGDDMGLGKTMQVISFLKQLHASEFVQHSLIVMPVSLIQHWVKEFESRQPHVRVLVYHGNNQRERLENLETIKRSGGVLITTYGMIVSNKQPLMEYKGKKFTWDYIVLDEGHKIKETKTQISKAMRELKARYKIIMTGTAIQNNLRELWSLFDWVCDGSLLGSVRSFATKFEKPILKAHMVDTSQSQKTLGSAVAESLRRVIAPHFLRREKKDVFPTDNKNNSNIDNNKENIENRSTSSTTTSKSQQQDSTGDNVNTSLKSKRMSVKGIKCKKNDLVCWIKLAEPQIELYKTFLNSEEVKDALNKTSSPLAALTVLKKISDHPLLLHEEMSSCSSADMKQIMQKVGENQTIKSLVRNSGKMQFLYYLLPNLKQEGHRLLIFSQSVKMLNAIEQLLNYLKLSFLRIDGSISSSKERQRRIDQFNNSKDIFCFLLTIQVGALGLNMTSADRVVIFDPSWNTVDNQAVDRVYRIGQTKDVVVYRLMCCGTIEEKIYRKQVFKGSLMETMMNQQKGQHRYFSASELKELFRLDDTNVSSTQQYLETLHSSKRKTSAELDHHLQFLAKLGMLAGLSDHDLLFSEEVSVDHNEDDVKNLEKQIATTPKQARKKKITIITKDTPNKSQIAKQHFIYVDDDYNDDEIDLTIETYKPRNTDDNPYINNNRLQSNPKVINVDKPAMPQQTMSLAPRQTTTTSSVAAGKDSNQHKSFFSFSMAPPQSPIKPVAQQQPINQGTKQSLIPQSVINKLQSEQNFKQMQYQSGIQQQPQQQKPTTSTTNNTSNIQSNLSASDNEYNRLIMEAKNCSTSDKIRSINLLLDALKIRPTKELEEFIKKEYLDTINN